MCQYYYIIVLNSLCTAFLSAITSDGEVIKTSIISPVHIMLFL